MTVLTSPRPTTGATALHQPLTVSRFGDLGRTGIIEDYTTTSWRVTSDGSSTTVTVGAVGNRAEVKGRRAEQTAQETVVLSTVSVGQERYTRIVLRLNLATDEVSVFAILGSAAASGSAVAPSIVRDTGSSGSWDLPLALVRQSGTSAITQGQITDERTWVGPYVLCSGTLASLPPMPLGSTARRNGRLFSRESVGGVLTWVDYFDPLDEQRTQDRALARPYVRVASLADGQVNTTGTVLGGSTFNVPVPTGAQRVAVRVDVTGVGPRDGSINGLFRLVVNGAQVSPEARVWGGDRSCSITGEVTLPASATVQVQTFARALGLLSGQTYGFTVDPATNLAYTLVFS